MIARHLHTVCKSAVCALVVASAYTSAACTSRSEGQRLAAQGQDHARRLLTLEHGIAQERAELQRELARLKEVLESATRVVTQNSANVGAEVEQLRTQVQTLEGQLAEAQNNIESTRREVSEQRSTLDARIQAFARRAGLDEPIPASEIPAERTEHFATAYREYQASNYSRARALFREYIQRYRTDVQADNAQYWIGASYLQENKPATALGELRKVITDFATGDAVDEALYDMADAFFRLGACVDARQALDTLVKNHHDSPLMQRTQEKLREIRRAPRGQCKT